MIKPYYSVTLQSGKRRDPSIGQKERVGQKEGMTFRKVGRFDRKEENGRGVEERGSPQGHGQSPGGEFQDCKKLSVHQGLTQRTELRCS